MNIFLQEQAERRQWGVASLITTICAVAMLSLALSSCKKPQPATAQPPIVILADTNRVKLQHRADSTKRSIIVLQQRANQSVTDYETAKIAYDSVRVDLP